MERRSASRRIMTEDLICETRQRHPNLYSSDEVAQERVHLCENW